MQRDPAALFEPPFGAQADSVYAEIHEHRLGIGLTFRRVELDLEIPSARLGLRSCPYLERPFVARERAGFIIYRQLLYLGRDVRAHGAMRSCHIYIHRH